jgi:hypothetical protein
MQMLLTKSNTPCPEALGSTNGLVQAVMCLGRIFSPAFVRYVLSVFTAPTIMINISKPYQRDFCFDRRTQPPGRPVCVDRHVGCVFSRHLQCTRGHRRKATVMGSLPAEVYAKYPHMDVPRRSIPDPCFLFFRHLCTCILTIGMSDARQLFIPYHSFHQERLPGSSLANSTKLQLRCGPRTKGDLLKPLYAALIQGRHPIKHIASDLSMPQSKCHRPVKNAL